MPVMVVDAYTVPVFRLLSDIGDLDIYAHFPIKYVKAIDCHVPAGII